MEEINKFSKGVNYDAGVIYNQPETATVLQNWVQISDNGYLFSLQNEKGPLQLSANLPEGFSIIGTSVLENDIILCLAHPDGYSQIGIINYTNTYTRIVPNSIDLLGDENSELGLDLNHPVDCVSRKLIRGDRVLYYTDNNTPFASINLDQTYITGDIADNIKIIPNMNNAIINFSSIRENVGGTLTAGVYQFIPQYQTTSNNWTTPGIPSNVIPMVPPNRSVGRDKYEGGDSVTPVRKAIVLDISNLDQSFSFFRIIAIKYSGNTNTFEATASIAIPITSENYRYTYSGSVDGDTILTKEEVTKFNITYNTAKAIEQKDQTLILSNLTEASSKFDHILQDIANNITVKYKITEQEYLENSNTSPVFDLEGTSILAEADTTFYLLFNKPVAPAVTTDVDVIVPAIGATNTVTITSYADLAGDTININGTVFTAIAGVPTPGTATFQYSVDNNTTAISLTDQINAYTFVPRDIGATYNGAIVTLIDIPGGVAGNADTLVYSNVGPVGLTIGAALFSGGVNSTTIPLTGITVDPDNSYRYIATVASPIYSYYGIYVNSLSSITGDIYTTPVSTTESITVGDIFIFTDNLQQGIANYKDEYNTFDKKGYRRSEVYSLGLCGELKEGSYTLNYHIPGNNKITASPAIPDTPGVFIGNTEGVCGTYVSTLEYPLNQFYPGNLTGDDISSGRTIRNITHHVMPSLQQEPSFRKDAGTGKLYIRIISLKLVFAKGFPQELKDDLQAYYITRQSRDSQQNTSLYAQGIVDRLVNSYLDYDTNDADPNGDVVKRKMPGFNNTTVSVDTFNPPGTHSGPRKSAGFVFNTPTTKDFMFLSPDTLFERLSPTDLQGLNIRAEQKLKSNPGVVAYNPSIYHLNNIGINTTTKLKTYPRLWLYGEYNDYEAVTAEGGKVTETSIVEAKKIDEGLNTNVAAFSNTLYNNYGEQDTFISTVDELNLGVSGAININIKAVIPPGSYSTVGALTQDVTSDDSYSLPATITNNLYNIYSVNPTQYGSVSSALYIPVKRIAIFPNDGDNTQVYGGDTFISRFAYSLKDNLQFKPYKHFIINATAIATFKYEYNGTGVPDTIQDATGYDIRTLQYFFVESVINCEYRHQFIDATTSNVGPTFYPKGGTYGTLATDPRVGEPNSYNTQYSFENKIKYFVNKSFDFKVQGRFATRSIYSERASLDDAVDYYKEFPINNFHDIPSNTGEIWDSFVFDNVLYLHTPKALWRTYFNNNTFIAATDVSEVVLGTGKEFSRPSETVITTTNGYAGTISQWGGAITSFGYVFVDALQGKVFLLAGNLSELSDQGAITFFRNIGISLKLGDSYKDNPFYGYGITSAYDTDNRRLLITKTNAGGEVNTDNAFTISYSLLSQSWMGIHTYHPGVYVTRDKNIYCFYNYSLDSKFYQLNKGLPGVYFDNNLYPSVIEYNLSMAYDTTKTLTNLTVSNQVTENNLNVIGSFTDVQVYNSNQNTSLLPIEVDNTIVPNYDVTKVLAKFMNNEYRIRLPRDIVIDPNLDITDPSNLDLYKGLKQKLKSKWFKVRLEYNNIGSKDFILNFVKSLFEQNYR